MNSVDEINTLDDYKKNKRCVICNTYMIGALSRKYCFCNNCFKKLPNELILQFNDAEKFHDIDKIKLLTENGITFLKKATTLKSKDCLICGSKVIFILRFEGPICMKCIDKQPYKWTAAWAQAVKKKRDDIKLELIDVAINGNYDSIEKLLVPQFGNFEYLGGHPDFSTLCTVALAEKPEGIVAFTISNEEILFTIVWDKITSISADTQRIKSGSHRMAALGVLAKRSDLAILGALTERDEETHFVNIGYIAAGMQTTISFKGKKAKEASAYFISERSKHVKEDPQLKAIESHQQSPSDDPIEKIRKLNELKVAGILSEKEFEDKKRDLLSKV